MKTKTAFIKAGVWWVKNKMGLNLKACAIISLILFLSSCATKPTPQQLSNADYGSYPADYENTVKAYLNLVLKDPHSAKYKKLAGPEKSWVRYFGPAYFGYAICYMINAKNSYGGYIGATTHYFMIKDGVVIKHISGRGVGRYDFGEGVAQKNCESISVSNYN